MNKTLHTIYVLLFVIVGIASTMLLIYNGYDYYSKPLEEIGTILSNPDLKGTTEYNRLKYQHENLKPTGFIGHGIGILGSFMMVFGVASYMIRKRVKRFYGIGYLKNWLEFHIFLCTVGPIFVLFHTSFKFGGLVAVSFWSMVLVVLSGVVGRFIYIQIPHTIQGQELDIKELNKIKDDLTLRLTKEYKIDEDLLYDFNRLASPERYKSFKLSTSIIFAVKDFFDVRKVLYKLKSNVLLAGLPKRTVKEVVHIAKSEIILARRIGLLRTMQKFFRYWHIFHLPFAIAMFAIMIIHIIVAITFGYTWIF